jgi:hypothetical protein
MILLRRDQKRDWQLSFAEWPRNRESKRKERQKAPCFYKIGPVSFFAMHQGHQDFVRKGGFFHFFEFFDRLYAEMYSKNGKKEKKR